MQAGWGGGGELKGHVEKGDFKGERERGSSERDA